jgi:hypothetical protein
MNRFLSYAVGVAVAGTLAGCANMTETQKTTATGAGVGAAAGAVIGGTVGASLSPTACTYVVSQDVPVVTLEKEVVVGEPLPETVVLYPIPETETYVFANVNGKRVIVDPKTRVVAQVVVQ